MSRFLNMKNNLFLTSASNGTVTVDHPIEGEFQFWFEKQTEKKMLFRLENVGVKKFLETNDEGIVSTKSFVDSDYQIWYYEGSSIFNLATRKCIESNVSNKVLTSVFNDSSSQKWIKG